jgi:hypothetical protein
MTTSILPALRPFTRGGRKTIQEIAMKLRLVLHKPFPTHGVANLAAPPTADEGPRPAHKRAHPILSCRWTRDATGRLAGCWTA